MSSAAGRKRPAALTTLLPIVATAFLLRMVFVVLNFRSLPASDHFERFGAEMGWTARSIATGHGFSSPYFPHTGPTALVCPLFPLLLAGVFKLFGVYTNASAFVALALNSLLSSLTAAVIFFGMRRRFGTGTAKAGAWIWALYPYAVYYSAVYLWDCALTSLLFASCFFLAITRLQQMSSRGWAAYGVLYGLAVLSNPSILTLLPFLLGYAAWSRVRLGGRVLQRIAFTAVALCCTLAPWSVRNMRVLHKPVLMRDGFWGEFYAGNAGDTSHSNPGWTHPASNRSQMQRYQQLGETGYMAEKEELSLERVRQHPGAFVEVSLRRVVRFWTGYWSFSKAYLQDEGLDVPNVPFCTCLTIMMLLGTWRLYRTDKRRAMPFLCAFLVFPAPYYVTHASIDYRQPIEPLVVVTITYGAAWLFRRAGSTSDLVLPIRTAA